MSFRINHAIPVLLFCVLTTSSASAVAETTIVRQLIAMAGDAAPGTDDGVEFEVLFNGGIDESGNLIFGGTLMGPGVIAPDNKAGWWMYKDDSLGLLSRRGVTVIPGYAPLYEGPNGLVGFAGGEVMAFESPFATTSLLWIGDPSGLSKVAAYEDQLSGLGPGEQLAQAYTNEFETGGLTPSGSQVFAFPIENDGVSTGAGLWFHESGSPSLVLRTGDQAPGLVAGFTVAPPPNAGAVPFEFKGMTDNGEIAMVAAIAGQGVNDTNDDVLWFGRPDQLNPIAREGGIAIGLGPDYVFDEFRRPIVGHGSHASLVATSLNEMDMTFGEGVWVTDGLGLELVAQLGQIAPGVGDGGATFAEFRWVSAPNAHGDLVFTAILSSGEIGVWAGSPDSLHNVILSGDHLPGDEGIEISIRSYDQASIDDLGRIKINGSGNDNIGEWLVDQAGLFHRLFRRGDSVEVSNGDVREITGFSHRNENFNNSGQVVATLHFTDGTQGVFRWTAVPEPSAILLMLVAVCVLSGSRIRRTCIPDV